MARSNYVWVVSKENDVVACFTVKHELITFLRYRSVQSDSPSPSLKVVRFTHSLVDQDQDILSVDELLENTDNIDL